jgi:Putative Ig domain
MIACRRFAGMLALSLILTLACLTNASAIPVTWTLSGMTFDDGGTASGYFIFDADADTLSASISVAGGNTVAFPPTTYQGAASPLSGDSTNGFYLWAPGQVGERYMNISHAGLTNAGGTVALALGNKSWECTNCGTIRYVTAGNAIGTPTPYFTSADAATFTIGTAGSFTVITAAATSVTASGTLPIGVTFTDNGDGTATFAGTPAAGSEGNYAFTLTAGNGAPPDATQGFTLIVDAAPVITSANAATFSVGSAATFTVTTTGFPVAALNEVGALPTGVTFTDNGDGTATLAGTPAAGSGGSYALTLTASNGASPDAAQAFTLTVDQPLAPMITSAGSAAFTAGTAGTFTITTTGFPVASLTETGALPAGVTFTDNGNGTATLSGITTSPGTSVLTITASNGVAPVATQTFTLTIASVAIAAPVPVPVLGVQGLFALLLLLQTAAFLALRKPRQTR